MQMSTFMAKTETVQRKWYVLDAAGKPAGRVAATAAAILRGKHKVDFTPNVDCGDFVVIVNASKAVFTGKKLEQKYYRTHSGYAGGLKETQYKTLMATKPELAIMPMGMTVFGGRLSTINHIVCSHFAMTKT